MASCSSYSLSWLCILRKLGAIYLFRPTKDGLFQPRRYSTLSLSPGSTLVPLPLIIVLYLFLGRRVLSCSLHPRDICLYVLAQATLNLILASACIVMVSSNILSNDLVIGLGLAFVLASIAVL